MSRSNSIAISWWQWPTVLSLDAPLVTMAWQWLFARDTGARLGWYHYAIVGASVWLAYAADRWLEGRHVPPERLITARHRFYHFHQRRTAAVWSLVLVGAVGLSFGRLTTRELAAGFILLAPTLTYVLSHQFLHRHHPWRAPKELCVAALVTAGAALFPAADAQIRIRLLTEAAAWFFVLALANCTLISAWELPVDKEHGQDSLVRTHPGWTPAVRLFPWLLAGAAILLLSVGPGGPDAVRTCAAVSAGLLGLVDRLQPRLGWAVARLMADAALLTPAVWLLGIIWIAR